MNLNLMMKKYRKYIMGHLILSYESNKNVRGNELSNHDSILLNGSYNNA